MATTPEDLLRRFNRPHFPRPEEEEDEREELALPAMTIRATEPPPDYVPGPVTPIEPVEPTGPQTPDDLYAMFGGQPTGLAPPPVVDIPIPPPEQPPAAPGFEEVAAPESQLGPVPAQVIPEQVAPPSIPPPPPPGEEPSAIPFDQQVATVASLHEMFGSTQRRPRTATDPEAGNPMLQEYRLALPPGYEEDKWWISHLPNELAQGVASTLSLIPKSIALWFSPDADIADWMNEMERLEQDPEATPQERTRHMARGFQQYGTLANIHTRPIFELFVETKHNTGEELAENRLMARQKLIEGLMAAEDRTLYQLGEGLDNLVKDALPVDPEKQDAFISKVFNGLGSAGGYALVFLATRRVPGFGGAGGGLATGTTGIMIQQAAAFEQALGEGADFVEAYQAAYSGYTAVAGASEALPIMALFNRVDKVTGGAFKRSMVRMLAQGTEEGIQESFQDVMANLAAADIYDPERQMFTMQTAEGGSVGFATGVVMEGLMSLLPGRRRMMRLQRAEAEVEGAPDSLEQQMAAARAQVAADGGDALAQTLAAAEVATQIVGAEAGQAELDAADAAAEEAARGEIPAAAEGAATPVDLSGEESTAVQQGIQAAFEEGIAVEQAQIAEVEAAYEGREAEAAVTREAEVQEAEYQREVQRGEAAEVVAEAEVAPEPVTIGEAIPAAERAGLEKLRAAKAAAAKPAVEAEPAPKQLEDLRADFAVTPEGEAIPRGEQPARVPRAPSATAEKLAAVEEPVAPARRTEVPALPGQRPQEETNKIIEAKANEAATSPQNAKRPPTPAEAEAGNYEKAHLTARDIGIPGVNVTVENPAGSTRTGIDRDGKAWSQEMKDHYGYIKGTESAEGTDQLDVFVGEDLESGQVFVVDQINQETGEFDEHKVMVGYSNQLDAVRAYKRNYDRGWKVGPVTPMSKDKFANWLERGDQTEALTPDLRAGAMLSGEEEFQAIVGRQERAGREPVVRFRAEDKQRELDLTATSPFYSRMRRSLAAKLPGKMPVGQLQTLIENLTKKGEFRAEEAVFYDLATQIAGREGSITREEILDLMDFRRPEIEEMLLQEPALLEFSHEAEAVAHLADIYGPLKEDFGPNGDVYDEAGNIVANIQFYGGTYSVAHRARERTSPSYYSYQPVDGGTQYREILITLPRKAGRFISRFKSRHYQAHENVLAHYRVSYMYTQDGERVFMIQEVQSDWHQAGRKYGYKNPAERISRERVKEAMGVLPSPEERWLDELLGTPADEGAVEAAPFEKTWPLMVMRRAIDKAVNEGSSWVALPTGEQVAELYDERNTADEISYNPEEEYLVVHDDRGNVITDGVMSIEETEGVIGKEMADRLRSGVKERNTLRSQYSVSDDFDEDAEGYVIYDPNGEVVRDWTGDIITIQDPEHIHDAFMFNDNLPGTDVVKLTGTDLKMGGDSLIRFYDQELVNVTNKWIKRFKSKIQDITLDTPTGPVTVHGFPVTMEMQTALMAEGQPLFRAEDQVETETTEEPVYLSLADAKAAVSPLTDEMPRLKPTILEKPSDAPAGLFREMRKRKALKAKGAFYDGKLYIFAGNHTSSMDVVRTLLHEGVAHQGLRSVLPETELNALLDEVYDSMSDEDIRAMRGRARAYADIDLTTVEGRRELAEERIAHLAEADPQSTFVQRVVAMLRVMLRKAGMSLEWKNDDIHALLTSVRRELRKEVPLSRITITTEVEVSETGEIEDIEEQADVALRQLTKRRNVIEQVRECMT